MFRWLKHQEPILAVYAFLFALAIAVAGEAYRLGLGTLNSPGPGFTYFWTAALLGILTVRLFFKVLRLKDGGNEALWRATNWRNVVWTVVALLVYAYALERLGYILVTFAFLGFLFWMLWESPKRWVAILGLALVATVVSYIVFDRWFALQLPKGLLQWP